MKDLFGDSMTRKTDVVAFHDERYETTARWLYHGFLVVEHSDWQPLTALLSECRRESSCGKPVHFVELGGSSRVSSRTRLGLGWAKALERQILPHARFFLLGVDLSRIERSLFGSGARSRGVTDMRIYNRFFEIGLFTALRWFFNEMDGVHLSHVVAEKRDLPPDDPFRHRAPYRINQRDTNIAVTCPQVDMVPAKGQTDEWSQAALDCLQLTDVLIGGFAQVLDDPNKKSGCIEIAEALLPRVRKMNQNPFNKNSRTWKRLAMRFFPDKSIAEQVYESERPYGMMYPDRPLKFADRGQLSLFDFVSC
jgi:hypothetical protein